MNKQLSNPFSTGGGGGHFEAHVQASFVALMLTGGHAPCLPCWPITEIKLQAKIAGFDTDDLVVIVEKPNSKERRKLLGQVKHSIAITTRSIIFGEVMQAAWNDFKNPKVFTRGKDIIALITGPISATDTHNVQWLLGQARHAKNVDEFFRNVQQAKFSSTKSTEKLGAIQHHLKAANGGNAVSNYELYDFLKHFHLLGYDLGNEFGVALSLLHSHISQFQQQNPKQLWSQVVDFVQTCNQNAGTITTDTLPDELLDAFKQKAVAEIPEKFKEVQEKPKTDWTQHPDATYIAFAVLIGAWQEKNQYDLETIAQLFGIGYDEWLKKAREILHSPDSPLSLKNGIWKVINRTELWSLLGSRILDQNLDTFKLLAISVLQERDPTFELPTEKRYAASIHGKEPKYSNELRKGISEGLAILGSQPEFCVNCSQENAEVTCALVIRKILAEADWVLWGSLNDLLPTLAEAAPDEFLNVVEKAMKLSPCPFDELFSQEGKGITGSNYLTGLLWALEGLAWDEQYLVRVCVTLGELASHDPGGQSSNRPFHSLLTILLPWYPQTLASIEKREVAVRTILRELPDIAWNLIIQLLPNQHLTSFGSHKPTWRKTIPDDWKEGVIDQEYWQQVSLYSELAVSEAGQDTARVSTLIDHFDSLSETAFDQFLHVLVSQPILELPEEQRLSVWNHLTKLTNKHRRFSTAKWALPNELVTRIEQAAEQLSPSNPFNLYQHLFTDCDFDLYKESGDWEAQRKQLEIRREQAILKIFEQDGVDSVIRFAETVSSTVEVGHALAVIADSVIERTFLPHFLDSENNQRKSLLSGFIWRSYHIKGWDWCDGLDKSDWTVKQVAQFLAYLPFIKETWDRASEWLQTCESEYWTCTNANAYQADDDFAIAVEKLIEYGRPHAAIRCLNTMLRVKQSIDCKQCVRALLAALSSNEPNYTIQSYHIVSLIKFLQAEPSVNQDDLFKVEWSYVPLLDHDSGAEPQLLESRLANDPEFFCEVIRLIYRSKNEDQLSIELSEESKAFATNAWQLLHEWTTPPGTQRDGTFSEECFNEWFQRVKQVCAESGHLEVALINIGEVLVYTPPDPDGLWIHRVAATVLNDHESDDLRNGFHTGIYNSRGAYVVDPTGEQERKLAEQFRSKAEEVEDAGFQRLAVTIRDLADSYDREAKRIINDHKNREGE